VKLLVKKLPGSTSNYWQKKGKLRKPPSQEKVHKKQRRPNIEGRRRVLLLLTGAVLRIRTGRGTEENLGKFWR